MDNLNLTVISGSPNISRISNTIYTASAHSGLMKTSDTHSDIVKMISNFFQVFYFLIYFKQLNISNFNVTFFCVCARVCVGGRGGGGEGGLFQ